MASLVSRPALPDNIERLIVDMKSHVVPQLKSAAMQGELDDAEHEMHDALSRLEGSLNAWAIDVIDVGRNARERQAWDDVLQAARKELVILRQSSSKALLEARQVQQQAQQANGARNARNALFAEMTTSEEERKRRRDARTNDQTADEQLMTASGDVTSALQRAVQLMSTELEKSSYSAQLLDESSVSIQQATLQYTSFTALVASSRKLIASMERADMVDAAMLLFSFLFFAACILYILKVRIWDKGVGFVSFFVRLLGLTSSRSASDVKEKLMMAKQAAMESASSISAAQFTASALSASADAASSSSSAALIAAQSASQSALEAASSSSASNAAISAALSASAASVAAAATETDRASTIVDRMANHQSVDVEVDELYDDSHDETHHIQHDEL